MQNMMHLPDFLEKSFALQEAATPDQPTGAGLLGSRQLLMAHFIMLPQAMPILSGPCIHQQLPGRMETMSCQSLVLASKSKSYLCMTDASFKEISPKHLPWTSGSCLAQRRHPQAPPYRAGSVRH